jgi:GT2 family glycosyltransferase
MTAPQRKQAANITVAIATRDRPNMVERCLKNLLSQSVLPREIVVADQSRDQQTAQIVERYKTGPVAVVYDHQSTQGLGTAQNRAIARASAEIVAITDDDCVPELNWLKAIEAALTGPDAVDFVTGPVFPYGPERPDTFPVATRTSTKRTDFDGRAMPWDIGSGNNFAVRRAWLKKVEGNDERLGPGSPGQGGVDMDLFYRLARAGARIRYEPDALVFHERASRASRLARRGPYGYGMGACCGLWLRQRDYNALRVLAHWISLRAQRLASGVIQRDRLRVHEELLVFLGTARGLLYGWRVGRRKANAGLGGRPESSTQ